MKVCGFVGSPIRNGNVDILVDKVLEGASRHGAIATRIHLNDIAIRPCQSCGVNPSPFYCCLHDDMDMVYTALEESDIVVIGSPVYFDTVSAQTKLMIDRCNCVTPLIQSPDGGLAFEKRITKTRNGLLVAVAGPSQDLGPIQATVAGFFNWVCADLMQTVFYGHETNVPGAVARDLDKLTEAHEAGARAAAACLERDSSGPLEMDT